MSIIVTRMRAFGRSNAGATAVEFALAAPILFLLMFAIIEFGRAWWYKNSLQYAVERAARYAVVCDINNPATCPSESSVKTFASNRISNLSVSPSKFTVRPATLASGQTVACVDYTYTYSPWFVGDYGPLAGAKTFTGTSCRACAGPSCPPPAP